MSQKEIDEEIGKMETMLEGLKNQSRLLASNSQKMSTPKDSGFSTSRPSNFDGYDIYTTRELSLLNTPISSKAGVNLSPGSTDRLGGSDTVGMQKAGLVADRRRVHGFHVDPPVCGSAFYRGMDRDFHSTPIMTTRVSTSNDSRKSSDGLNSTVDRIKYTQKPATFDGLTSWIDYKSHFEICAELNQWSDTEKGMYLAVSLRGQAQGVLGNLPERLKRDYYSLLSALEERFAPANQKELYRAQLKDRRQKASESLPELGQDIRRLVNLAYHTAPHDVIETLARGSFIDALMDSNMRLKVKQARTSY